MTDPMRTFSTLGVLSIAILTLAPSPARAEFVTVGGEPLGGGELRVAASAVDDGANRGDVVDASSGSSRANAERVAPACRRFVLESTRVDAEISSVLARVRVEQVFGNPFAERLEAVYVFPLPENAAVDRYAFEVGEVVIEGVVRERDEARREYEAARDSGQKGALLEEERDDVFTQSIANIPPGERVRVRIEYVHPLAIDGASHVFRFPMVVAPRYIPGTPLGGPSLGRGWSPDTDQVAGASRISPPVMPAGQRGGNDVEIRVRIDAGMPIDRVTPVTHEVGVERDSETTATVTLQNGPTIANKDFVLEYAVAGERTVLASLAHRNEGDANGYVALVLQPTRDPAPHEIVPREVIFLLDQSGSMDGPPIAQMRVLAQGILEGLDPRDTFRIVAFSSRTRIFDHRALEATTENRARGLDFVRGLAAGSGTELLPALRVALGARRGEEDRPRYLVLITDALVGNDDSVLGFLRHGLFDGVRIFPIAVGAAPNHYLIERAAEIGRGFAMQVTNEDNAAELARRFTKRTAAPILTDLVLDWGGLEVADIVPSPLPDLHAGEPLVVLARFATPGASTVRLRANAAGAAVETDLPVTLPAVETAHDSIESIWARARVRQIWNRNVGNETPESRAEITRLGLEHSLVTRYTSFVAVEKEAPAPATGKLRSEQIALMLPEGMTASGAPAHAFRDPNASAANGAANGAAIGAAVVANQQSLAPPPASAPPASRGDRGLRLPRVGGGGGGSVEWVFLGTLALAGIGRAASRRRRGSDSATS